MRHHVPSLLPSSLVVRTLLAFSLSFSSVLHVQWPQYHPPSFIISTFISMLPLAALTGNLTICIEKLLSSMQWERTVLHNYKWCAAAGQNWHVHVGELRGEWNCYRYDLCRWTWRIWITEYILLLYVAKWRFYVLYICLYILQVRNVRLNSFYQFIKSYSFIKVPLFFFKFFFWQWRYWFF